MEKQKLLDRLVELEAALAKKNQQVQQDMADMNFLLGQKAELQNLLADPSSVEESAEAAPLHAVELCSEAVCEVVIDVCEGEVLCAS